MNHIQKLSLALVVFGLGCQSKSPVESRIDVHPTKIVAFYSNGLIFNSNKAVVIAAVGDTIPNEIIATDEDGIVSYGLPNRNSTLTTNEGRDTVNASFGFIADSSYFAIGKVNTERVVFTDGLGFTTMLEIEIYIKSN